MAETTYTVTAPLIIAKNAEGSDVYVYQGGTVPAGQSQEWVSAHVDSDMIAAADASAEKPAAKKAESA